MKIENIKSYLVYSKGHRAGMIGGKNWLFVKVETDEGIHGWGECYTQLDRDRSIQAHVEELGRYLVGRDPCNIKHTTQMAYDDYAGRRGSMEFYCALSGIEQAMWDIQGKALGVPVHALLGGAIRDRLQLYWSHCGTYRLAAESAKIMGKPQLRRLEDLVAEFGNVLRSRELQIVKWTRDTALYQQPGAYHAKTNRGAHPREQADN